MIRVKQRELKARETDFPDDWHPLVKKIYASRVNNCQEVNKALTALLPPRGLPDIEKAAERLWQAIDRQESILIYGDYDVDGATGTALLYRGLQKLGANIHFFIPNRWQHGYGLSISGIDDISVPYSLIVTVDNGIRSFEAATYLKTKNVDLIITDHHEPDQSLPEAIAVVNPKRKDAQFASKNLAGVGVAFYLLSAMRQYAREKKRDCDISLTQYLDLVALGTVADIVPLDYNNRILVHCGIANIKNGKINLGIRALCEVASIDLKQLRSQDFSFSIAPRLNAVGRLDDMSEGVTLLLTDDWATAQDYAELLDGYNRDRKAVENHIIAEAQDNIDLNLPIIAAYKENWHEGVIGIVASKLKSRYTKPALVATDTSDRQKVKASLRSIKGVDIHHLLTLAAKKLPENCLHFGGHAMAAGLSIDKAYYKALIDALCKSYDEIKADQSKDIDIYHDGALSLDLFNVQWAKYLEYLEPWGSQLPTPAFHNAFIVHECRKLGAQHTRIVLREPQTGQILQATWFFNQCDYSYGTKIYAVYQIEINRFYGDERLQLLIEHVYLNKNE